MDELGVLASDAALVVDDPEVTVEAFVRVLLLANVVVVVPLAG